MQYMAAGVGVADPFLRPVSAATSTPGQKDVDPAGGVGVPSVAVSSRSARTSTRPRRKVGVTDMVLSSSGSAGTPTLARAAAAAKDPMQEDGVGAPELTLATGYA